MPEAMTGAELDELIGVLGYDERGGIMALAKKLDVSHTTISKWRADQLPIPLTRADQLRGLLPRGGRASPEYQAWVARRSATEPREPVRAQIQEMVPAPPEEQEAAPLIDSEPCDVREVVKDAVAEVVDVVEGKLDAFGSRLDNDDAKLDAAAGKLDVVAVHLKHADARLGVVDAKLDGTSARLDKAKRDLVRALVGTGIGAGGLVVLAAVVVVHCQPAPSALPVATAPAMPAPVIVNIGPGAVEEATRAQQCRPPLLLGAIAGTDDMGKKVPEENWIPSSPLPHQKVPPCETRLYEVAMGPTFRTSRIAFAGNLARGSSSMPGGDQDPLAADKT